MLLGAVLALAISAPFEAPTRVDGVRVTGLWFSKEATVLRELPFRVGDDVTPTLWDLFETRLWNLGIFSRVKVELLNEDGRSVALVTVEDRFPIGPVIRANFGGGQFFFWLGVADVNLFGRAIEGRAFYERFGSQNGFHVHLLDPRLFNQRVSGLLEVEWLSRPQPEYIVRRAAVRLAVETNAPGVIDDLYRLGLKVEGNSDELFEVANGPTPLPVNSRALFVGPYLRAGRLDVDRLRYVHGFAEVHADFATTSDPSYPLAALFTFEGQYFWKVGSLFNIGTRLLAGLERGARPQDRFYIGGLDKVRGYLYSEIRARQYAVANLEARFVAFDSMWFAVMPIAFVDGGAAQRDTQEIQPLFSFGAGIRFMVPRLPRFGVRFEVALPVIATRATTAFHPGINFGVWHYF